jgi:hypothetical protein
VSFEEFRRRANAVRGVPLEAVLQLRGAARDRHDRSKWRTERGSLSITGTKFTAWQRAHGGGGAIDLVMHLADVDARAAVEWLEQHASHLAVGGPVGRPSGNEPSVAAGLRPLCLPERQDGMLNRVRQYLTRQRHLPPSLIDPLMQSGTLYADRRGNAVFLMVAGKPHRPVGAELRGTGARVWRGMASGSRKDAGYFWIGQSGSKEIVLCESAIDAISCLRLYPERICISTSGVRANPRWLRGLIAHGYRIHCGFDADEAGETAAAAMLTLHPEVARLRPPAHDWNDVLTSGA